MDFGQALLNIFGFSPGFLVGENLIRVRTPLLTRLLTFFLYCRDISVDRAGQVVVVRVRTLWFFARSRTIPFHDVEYIDTEWVDVSTNEALPGPEIDTVRISVGLVLHEERDQVHLFSFNQGSGTLLGSATDNYTEFVSLLSEFLGVPVGKPLPHFADAEGNRFFCSACGRPSPPNQKKCMYCGGALIAKGE